MTGPRTLYDKIVDAHLVRREGADDRQLLLYIDRTVLNEYTSPQAFSGLRAAGRSVWRPSAAIGVVDHVNPTAPDRGIHMADPSAEEQAVYFRKNCQDFGIDLYDVLNPHQGIEHVIMPELGRVLPGMVIAAGDSHTTTYGALGALGFGIGTSDIEHYLATQTVPYRRLRTMQVNISGSLPLGTTAKDLIMAVIRQIGADGATGFAIEFSGEAISVLSVEGRMTICNMAVECGARGALIAPDDKAIAYVLQRCRLEEGARERAIEDWQYLRSDPGAPFHRTVHMHAGEVEPMVTWGTSPDQAVPIGGSVPDPAAMDDDVRQAAALKALQYMDLEPGRKLDTVRIDRAFIGSCTNARIEDLRLAASIIRGRAVHPSVRAMVVPGSGLVREMAQKEGLADIFIKAGFEWRQAGCSMCLAMNDDVLRPGERCASSTNRNFEGRQGSGGRTHLMSPAMVAAAAIAGHLVDCRDF